MSWTVDAHHHLWDLQVTPQDWLAGEPMAPIRRSFLPGDLVDAVAGRVEKTVIVQTVSEPDETEVMLDYAAGCDLIGGVVGWVDLTGPEVEAKLEDLLQRPNGHRLVGIRHQVQDEPDTRWLCRPDVRRGLAAVGAAGLVYDLLTIPSQLPAAIETVAALPNVSFVVDHISKPEIAAGVIEPWATDIANLASFPNVTCKLSGMITEADWQRWTIDDLRPVANIVLEVFGPDRVMFGSDWPVCLLAGTYADVADSVNELTAHLDPNERAAIFGGVAARVYGLSE